MTNPGTALANRGLLLASLLTLTVFVDLWTQDRDLVESYKLGVNSYIQKPVDFNQFRETVKQLGLYWLVVNQPPLSSAFQNK